MLKARAGEKTARAFSNDHCTGSFGRYAMGRAANARYSGISGGLSVVVFKIPSFRVDRRWRYLAKVRSSGRNGIACFMIPSADQPPSPKVATQPEGWSWAVARPLRGGQPEDRDHRAHLLSATSRIRGVEAEGEHAAQEGTSSNREVAAAIQPHGTPCGKSSRVTQFGSAARSVRTVTLRFRAGLVRR